PVRDRRRALRRVERDLDVRVVHLPVVLLDLDEDPALARGDDGLVHLALERVGEAELGHEEPRGVVDAAFAVAVLAARGGRGIVRRARARVVEVVADRPTLSVYGARGDQDPERSVVVRDLRARRYPVVLAPVEDVRRARVHRGAGVARVRA